MLKKFKKIDYRHYILSLVVIGSLLLAIFYFKYADNRLLETFIDFKNSFLYYISELFDFNLNYEITINDFTKQPFEMPFNLPSTWEEFKLLCKDYWVEFKKMENVKLYFTFLSLILQRILKFIILIMPFVMIIYIIVLMSERDINNNYNEDTKALKFWKNIIENKIYLPVKHWIQRFILFTKEHSIYIKLIIFIWLYSFNIYAIGIEVIAYYLYFVISFDLVNIYVQLIKLLFDMSIILDFIPVFIWVIITLYFIDRFRKKVGYIKLNHLENKNKGFINERPLLLMLCGSMGKKKTTIGTDVLLSIETMFRNKAFELLLEADLKFPNFPWINLENYLKTAIKRHKVFNLATTKRFINMLELCFKLSLSDDIKTFKSVKRNIKRFYGVDLFNNCLFDYDYERYGFTYNNNLFIQNIWEVINDYAQLYFVYIVQSSLIISNYSIRTDNILHDVGNFPLWDMDFFKRDSKYLEAYSRHAHILDFDGLRLGKTVLENNKKTNALEFGIFGITEVGKERGNTLELQQVKKNDDLANQKNDLFNHSLKMARHKATICNYPFIRFVGDEQRPESWGADARDLCEIVHIDECSETRLTMPFFALEDLICNWYLSKFNNRYSQYRFEHGNNTLLMYLYHNFSAKINNYHKRILNTFGYYKLDLLVEAGTQDSPAKEKDYYLMFKKIYSKRFSTDCFSDFFTEKSYNSTIGIDDLEEYKTEKATFDEMVSQNSYFFNDLNKLRKGGK